MIFVWGRKSEVRREADQRELVGLFTPCLKRGCNGRNCGLYRVEMWCTIYFCIPLCLLDTTPVVKCRTCGTMWAKEVYLRAIQADRQRDMGMRVSTPVASANRMDRTDTNASENVARPYSSPSVAAPTIVEEDGTEHFPLVRAMAVSDNGSPEPTVVTATIAPDCTIQGGEVAMVARMAAAVEDENKVGFGGSRPTQA